MKVLIAEDEVTTRRKLEALLDMWKYEVVSCADGTEAWDALQKPDAPHLAILDWQMPGLCGDEICRRARATLGEKPLHLIILTATRMTSEDMIAGLQAGADDYLIKPCNTAELQARLKAGERAVTQQLELLQRIRQSEKPLAHFHQTEDVVVCRYCRKMRDDDNRWLIEVSFGSMFPSEGFAQGVCPTCVDEQLARIALDEL